MVELLNRQPLLALIVILALGLCLGTVNFKGLKLGSSGVLFMGLVFGHFQVELPELISSLGVTLFVYVVGLQAGPRFVSHLKRRGLSMLMLAFVALSTAFLATVGLAWMFDFSPALACGLFAGSLTSTPGLAAALETLQDPNVSVGYGASYPFGVLGVLLFVQLAPKLLRLDLAREAETANQDSAAPKMVSAWFEVKNPLLAGCTVGQLTKSQLNDSLLSRVAKGADILAASADVVLELGDKVRAVGADDELTRLQLLIGPQVLDFQEPPSNVTAMTLLVTEEAVVGKSLAELQLRERYRVNVTRLWREELEFFPKGSTVLEIGDRLRIAGHREDCQRLAPLLGQHEERAHQTNFLPLMVGLLAGLLVGMAPWSLPGGLQLKLGLAGGPMFVGLLVGHFGRMGPLNFRVPLEAKIFVRELGLMFFLAGAGVSGGAHFVEVLRSQGISLILAGILITLLPMLVSLVFALRILRWDALTSLGALCGAMTSTPGLSAVTQLSSSPAPSLSYVAVYPTALLGVTLLSPLLGLLLSRLL